MEEGHLVESWAAVNFLFSVQVQRYIDMIDSPSDNSLYQWFPTMGCESGVL